MRNLSQASRVDANAHGTMGILQVFGKSVIFSYIKFDLTQNFISKFHLGIKKNLIELIVRKNLICFFSEILAKLSDLSTPDSNFRVAFEGRPQRARERRLLCKHVRNLSRVATKLEFSLFFYQTDYRKGNIWVKKVRV